MEFVPISIDVIGPLSIMDFILVEHLKGIHSRIQRTHSYNDLDTLGMISKEDPVQCEADERALEVCVDFSDGGIDVGGGIRRDENRASALPASLILSERTSHENDQVAFFWKQARRLQTTDMETRACLPIELAYPDKPPKALHHFFRSYLTADHVQTVKWIDFTIVDVAGVGVGVGDGSWTTLEET
ncbi:hypothetical protein ARMSODRAFT_1024799 [Armillaria solidipes]|uniref:Uncharacterized protein n=1 Tax=Armillaria solidipes TaxID=1076256 RepID=A0A2H3BHR3_9AGAR|nr:hypothetical protein ARMSODRAFT_1024799 [Armillaria solidipes]